MSLRKRLGYDTDYITVWEEIESLEKDEFGRPIKKWEKSFYKGKWENVIRVLRNMTGEDISSVATVIIPILIDIKKNILIEEGESQEEKPSTRARKILSFEEITRLRKKSNEWIYYV